MPIFFQFIIHNYIVFPHTLQVFRITFPNVDGWGDLSTRTLRVLGRDDILKQRIIRSAWGVILSGANKVSGIEESPRPYTFGNAVGTPIRPAGT